MEDWITIRNLKKRNPNWGTRKIAKLLSLSRNTVKRALKSDTGPKYQRPNKINLHIAPFKDVIYEMLIVKKFRGSRVLNEIKSKGFQGSKSAFYRYIATLSQTQSSVFEALENSFMETAGVPERLQTDTDKCFIINASKDNFQWNKRYLYLN